jgi:flagellar FliL protein
MSKKVIILIAAASVLLLGLMGAGFFVIWSKVSNMAPGGEPVAQQAEAAEEAAKPTIGPIYSLESFIVNLAEPGGKRYLRVTMDLELSTEAVAEEITKRLPQVRNSMLMILPSKKFEEISTIEGKNTLRDEIVVTLNEFLQTGTVTNLYFTEFVVQ